MSSLPSDGIQAESAPAPTLAALFMICFKIGLSSFGGGLSGWFYREFVLNRPWISDEDFASTFAMCQMLPGANIINLAICIGEQLLGARGSVVAVLGLVVGPFFILIAAASASAELAGNHWFETIANGVTFAAIGLLIVIAMRGVRRSLKFPPYVAVIAITAVAVAFLKLSLVLVVLLVSPVSVWMAWRRH